MSLLVCLAPVTGRAEALSNPDFIQTWSREDGPVAAGQAGRTWLWGPEPFTAELREPYGSAPSGERAVQYFDKARMEVNNPDAERDRWYVTTGLLASELMTGGRQQSDSTFEQRGPALIPVAGDFDDPEGPTYASFNWVRHSEPFNTGATLTATIDRAGHVGYDQHFARYAVLAEHHVPETDHTVASVFWAFLNATGTVQENGVYQSGRLFEPWFYVTGLPVTEAYWASVMVGGVRKDVLIQVFERRVLTYTPSNDPAWRVELGNVGRHYYAWRYDRDAQMPVASGDLLWPPDLSGVPSARADDASWEMGWDPVSQSYRIVNDADLDRHEIHTVSRYWSNPGGQLDDYRISVEIQIQGSGEVGIGVRVAGDGDSIDSMVYFGVTSDGVRTVTLEDNSSSQTHYLIPPAAGLSNWDTSVNAWNTLAMTIYDDRVWVDVGGVVVGEAELPEDVQPTGGIALNVTAVGASEVPASYGFRNLIVESVRHP